MSIAAPLEPRPRVLRHPSNVLRRAPGSAVAAALLAWVAMPAEVWAEEAAVRVTAIRARSNSDGYYANYPVQVTLSMTARPGAASPSITVGLLEASSTTQRFWRAISGSLPRLRTCQLGSFRLDIAESGPRELTVTKEFIIPVECLPKEDREERFNFWIAVDPVYAEIETPAVAGGATAAPARTVDNSLERVPFFTQNSSRFTGLDWVDNCEVEASGVRGCGMVVRPFPGGTWALLGNRLRFPIVSPPEVQSIALTPQICHETLGQPDFTVTSLVAIYGLPPREPARPGLPPTNIATLMAEESVLRYSICPAAPTGTPAPATPAGTAAVPAEERCAPGTDYAPLKVRNWVGPEMTISMPASTGPDGVAQPARTVTKTMPTLLDEMSPRVWNLGAPLDVTNDLYIAPDTDACRKLSGPWRSHRLYNLRTCWTFKDAEGPNRPSCRVVKVELEFPPPAGGPKPVEPATKAKSGYQGEWRKSYMGGFNLGVDMTVEGSQHVDVRFGGFSRTSATIDLVGEQLPAPLRVGTLQLIATAPLPGDKVTNTLDVYFMKPDGEAVQIDKIIGPGAIGGRKEMFEVPVEADVPLRVDYRASNAEVPVSLKVSGTIKVTFDAKIDVRQKGVLSSLPIDKVGFTAATASVTDPTMLGSMRYVLAADFELSAYMVFAPTAPPWWLDAVLKEIPQREGEVKLVDKMEHMMGKDRSVLRVRVASNMLRAESSADWALGRRDGRPAMRSKWTRGGTVTVSSRRAAVHLVATPRPLALCGEHATVKFFFDCPPPVPFVQAVFQGEGISHEREALFSSVPTSGEDIVQ